MLRLRLAASADEVTSRRFEYVVVGAGSSGATLATRLGGRIAGRVLLLEAGAARHKDFWIRVPVGLAKILSNPDYVWPFNTEPQAGLAGQPVYWPRGRLPGGSSSINGMVFVRGEPAEFDHWRELGNVGWGYADVLPYFKRLEATSIGASDQRGRDGPVSVIDLAADPDELSDAFLSACREAGIAPTKDYNGGQYEGVGYLQLSTVRGERCSTARAYLDDLPRRPNFTLETEAVATRVLFEGQRAIGVEYRRGGKLMQAYAEREVILAAGPIKSPQLLELSGVGNAALLQTLGVPVVHHLPGVGENLIDHLQSRLTYARVRSITLNEILASPLRQAWMGAKYLAFRRGLMATRDAPCTRSRELRQGRSGRASSCNCTILAARIVTPPRKAMAWTTTLDSRSGSSSYGSSHAASCIRAARMLSKTRRMSRAI